MANAFTISARALNSLHYSLVYAVGDFDLMDKVEKRGRRQYARLNTGGSIIRGNSGNGALPTLNGKNVGNKNVAPNDRAFVGLPCSWT